ncbi:MAG: SEL1-like repeat protein [Pseudomonadota bacterium]
MARTIFDELAGGSNANASNEQDVYFDLGIMYSTGRSVDLDLVAAHKWFNLAASKGKVEAKALREDVAGEMTAAQITKALHDARAFMSEQRA